MGRNLLCAAVCLTLLVGAAGCRAQEEPIQPVPGVTSSMLAAPNRGVEELEEGAFKTPVLLITAGRSADLYVAQTLLKQSGVPDVLTVPRVIPGDVIPYYGALVVAVGGSEKGLAAAGVTVEKEAEHIRAVLEAAREQNIPILALHIGGYGRRGDVTDPLIQTVFPFADGAVILEEGDPDGLMLDLLNRADIPADYVAEPIDAVPVFQRIFRVAPGSGIPPEDDPGAGPDELPGISQAENS